jgi:hypothetical protein
VCDRDRWFDSRVGEAHLGRSSLTGATRRAGLLVVTGGSLYFVFPSLVSVFGSWRALEHLNWYWVGAALLAETASFASLWQLDRIALRTKSWFVVACTQTEWECCRARGARRRRNLNCFRDRDVAPGKGPGRPRCCGACGIHWTTDRLRARAAAVCLAGDLRRRSCESGPHRLSLPRTRRTLTATDSGSALVRGRLAVGARGSRNALGVIPSGFMASSARGASGEAAGAAGLHRRDARAALACRASFGNGERRL